MIYMEPSQLGWKPLVISWMNTLPDPLQNPENHSLILDLFHWLIPPSLQMLRKHCRVRDLLVSEDQFRHFFFFLCATQVRILKIGQHRKVPFKGLIKIVFKTEFKIRI